MLFQKKIKIYIKSKKKERKKKLGKRKRKSFKKNLLMVFTMKEKSVGGKKKIHKIYFNILRKHMLG